MGVSSNILTLSLSILLICIINLKVCYANWNTQDFLKREHSLVKPYQGGGVSMPLWDFVGSTMVTNQFVRLTSDHQSKKGAIWNSVPLNVHNWELHVQFKVHGQGTSLYGDGIALWYTRDRLELGSVFGSKDHFSGLGLFIDTYSNHNGPHHHGHPFVSAMVSNGTLDYDHDTDGTHTQVAGCQSSVRNQPHDTHVAVRYENNVLKVSLDVDGKNGWKECFEVRGVELPTGYYIGASAATGDLADNHDIISLKLYELDNEGEQNNPVNFYNIIPSAAKAEAPREHVDDEKRSGMSGLKLFMVIFLTIVGLGVCGIVGFVLYSNRDTYNKRKRFY